MRSFCWGALLVIVSAKLQFSHSAYGVPGVGKLFPEGHDRYMIKRHILVLADGTGGWEEKGINPGEFARSLVKKIRHHFRRDPKNHLKNLPQLVNFAAQRVNVPGTATCIVAVLDRDHSRVSIVNIGDTSYIHFRKGQNGLYYMVSRGQPKEIQPNMPLQIGRDLLTATSGDFFTFDVKVGDRLLLATDGVFDNLYDEDILALFNASIGMHSNTFVRSLVELATAVSFSPRYFSPFAWRARKYNASTIQLTGKPDDITAIVAGIDDF